MASVADVLRAEGGGYFSPAENYYQNDVPSWLGQRGVSALRGLDEAINFQFPGVQGSGGGNIYEDVYNQQVRAGQTAAQEAYNPVEDFIPTGRVARLLGSGLGGLALGALKPVGGPASGIVNEIRSAFAPAFLKQVEAIGARGVTRGGRQTTNPLHQALKDIDVRTAPSLSEILATPEVGALFARQPKAFEQTMKEAHNTRGLAAIPTIGTETARTGKPTLMIAEPYIGSGTGIHEGAHVGFDRLRPSTADVLEKSFLRRAPDILDQLRAVKDKVAIRYLSALQANKAGAVPMTHKERLNAINELFARSMQGRILPTGPERHLLTPTGRALAMARNFAMD